MDLLATAADLRHPYVLVSVPEYCSDGDVLEVTGLYGRLSFVLADCHCRRGLVYLDTSSLRKSPLRVTVRPVRGSVPHNLQRAARLLRESGADPRVSARYLFSMQKAATKRRAVSRGSRAEAP